VLVSTNRSLDPVPAAATGFLLPCHSTFAGDDRGLATLDRAALRPVHREMRMAFQDPFASLNPRMTVEQVVGEPLRVNGLLDGHLFATG
jgi:ABC-type microcin C transport system duplicated ATPase subunit YejF